MAGCRNGFAVIARVNQNSRPDFEWLTFPKFKMDLRWQA
jgi:hypothetical protein